MPKRQEQVAIAHQPTANAGEPDSEIARRVNAQNRERRVDIVQ